MTISHIGIIAKDDACASAISIIASIFPTVRISRIPGELPLDTAPDVIITLGGDGTLLSAIDHFPTTPIMGINFGTVGFLTAAQKEDLAEACTALKEGDYHEEERPLIELSFRGNTYLAFNEVVIKGLTKVVELNVSVDDFHINTLRGDGIIVGTSAGSTAYLLSTGGPIVSPGLDCFILAGLNEYSLVRNPMVLDNKHTITITLSSASLNTHVYLVYDGKPEMVIEEGEQVTLTRATKKAKLLYLDKNHFFQALRYKLKYGQCHPS